jgi:hypothetical protein
MLHRSKKGASMAHQAQALMLVEDTWASCSSPRSGLSAATGIATGLAISAGFWLILGYAIHRLV